MQLRKKVSCSKDDRRYLVLKMYTESELNTLAEEKHKALSEHFDVLAEPSIQKEVLPTEQTEEAVDPQMFTPSTKTVIEEIALHTGTGESSKEQPASAKRAINFGILTDQDIAGLQLLPPEVEVDHMLKSPSKKAKGKNKLFKLPSFHA